MKKSFTAESPKKTVQADLLEDFFSYVYTVSEFSPWIAIYIYIYIEKGNLKSGLDPSSWPTLIQKAIQISNVGQDETCCFNHCRWLLSAIQRKGIKWERDVVFGILFPSSTLKSIEPWPRLIVGCFSCSQSSWACGFAPVRLVGSLIFIFATCNMQQSENLKSARGVATSCWNVGIPQVLEH